MKKIIIAIVIIALTIILIITVKEYQKISSATNIETDYSATKKKTIIFNFIDINNITHSEETIQNKYLIVNYWATWCQPCLQEIPILVDFYNNNSDKVEILGLNYDEDDFNLVYEFKDIFNITYPIILNNDTNAKYYANFIDLKGLPTTIIYSKEGGLMHTFIGEISMQDLEKFIP